MPAPQTPASARAILARETDEVFLDCLVISGPGLGPHRFVLNNEPLERAEGTFLPFSFSVDEPEDSDQLNPTMTIRIDNVDREIIRQLKEYPDIPVTRFETVLASAPDTVVHGPFEFSVRSAEADQLWVTIECGHEEDFLNQGFPKDSYGPINSPGLYV